MTGDCYGYVSSLPFMETTVTSDGAAISDKRREQYVGCGGPPVERPPQTRQTRKPGPESALKEPRAAPEVD